MSFKLLASLVLSLGVFGCSAAPDQGQVVLTLGRNPLELRRWAVTDPQGLTTRIQLVDLRAGMPLDRDLFVWRDPKMFGWPKD